MFNQIERTFVIAMLQTAIKYKDIIEFFKTEFNKTITRQTIWRLANRKLSCYKRRGRPRITSINENDQIEKLVKQNRWSSWNKIRVKLRRLSINISSSTIKRRCKERNLKSYVAKSKPALTFKLSKQRLKLAKKLAEKDLSYYKRICFSDESTVYLRSTDSGKIWVKRHKEQYLDKDCVKKKRKYNGKGINFWCFLNYNGLSDLVLYKAPLTAEKYIEIIKENLKPQVEKLKISNYILLEDKHSAHTAMITKKFYEEFFINSLQIPGNSPDFNCCETVFFHLKKKIFEKVEKFKNLHDLEMRIRQCWEELRKEEEFIKLKNMIVNYKRRLDSIIAHKGYNSKY